jgi:hypothetical protein
MDIIKGNKYNTVSRYLDYGTLTRIKWNSITRLCKSCGMLPSNWFLDFLLGDFCDIHQFDAARSIIDLR